MSLQNRRGTTDILRRAICRVKYPLNTLSTLSLPPQESNCAPVVSVQEGEGLRTPTKPQHEDRLEWKGLL